MYTIIGADGRHYGPVTLEQMKAWIAEGRVAPATLVQVQGETEWKQAAGFPELTPPPAPPPVLQGMGRTGAENKIAAGICGILLGALGVHKFILGYPLEGMIMLLVSVVGGIVTCWISTFVMAVIGLIEGIVYLTKSDEQFVATYVNNKRGWF